MLANSSAQLCTSVLTWITVTPKPQTAKSVSWDPACEVKLLQKMHHPMIIGYYDYFIFENQLAIVMQYAEGGTMERLVHDQKGVNFPESQVLNYFTQILIALNHIHSKSIVHRDLKTQNILLNRYSL
ncbi:hypothetical protein OSTOST_13691 [Ostertagia ostertagi]